MTAITSTELGGTGRYIRIAATSAINDKIKTIIAYCRPTAVSAAGAGYLAGKTPSNSTAGLRLYVLDNSASPQIGYGDSSSLTPGEPGQIGAANSVTYGSWCHLIATDARGGVTGSDVHVLVNGTNADATASSGSGTRPSNASNDLFLLNRGDAAALGREIVGDVAYVACYDSVLSGAQITNVMTNGPMAELSSLIFVFANNTIYSGGADPGATVTVAARSTRVTGALPPNTALGDPAGPTISVHPANQTVTTPATATFSVTATASGGGTLSYQWQRNPAGVGAFANVATGTGGTTSSYTTAATSVSGGNANSTDTWRCVVTETGGANGGSTNSSAATLTVNATASGPTINTQPTNQSVTAPGTATFTVAATTSGGALSYQWQRNATNISGATSASYVTPTTTVSGGTANNGDAYRCNVTDSNGTTTSSAATLTVNAGAATVTWTLKNNTGTLLASTTVPKVKIIRLSDMASVLDLTSQASAVGTALMTVSNAVLTAGVDYLAVCSDATGANVGVQKVTAV